jgi:galactokinase
MLSKTTRWLKADSTILKRINVLRKQFEKQDKPIVVCLPGRAELLGSHTDYNQGVSLSATISQNLLMLAIPRQDTLVRISSIESKSIVEFRIDTPDGIVKQKAKTNSHDVWANYVKGVIWRFKKEGLPVKGFTGVLQSTIPVGAGVSSSAALELATAYCLTAMNNISIPPEQLAIFAKDAENEYVGTPCGYLDQATEALADESILQIDYRSKPRKPFAFQQITNNIADQGYLFVIGYDPKSTHALVDGKYALRQNACFESIALLKKLLPHKSITALRDVSSSNFSQVKEQFMTKKGKQITDFVTHVIYENERVKKATKALQRGDLVTFGEYMIASGKSALDLYQLDEDAPELRFVYEFVLTQKKALGVLGIRNMGGGFNATTLALVKNDTITNYKNILEKKYYATYHRPYQFIEFVPSPSAGTLSDII